MADADALAPEALHDLAVFPLPDVVFFPGTLLPLHIFEPRYRQMTAEVLAQATPLMAVVRLRTGWEADYYGNPPVHEVASVGKVIHHERLEDGRYNILLQGLARVRLVAPTLEAPYRRMRAEVIADRYPPATDLGVATAALLACCQRLGPYLPEVPRALKDLSHSGLEPSVVADVLGSAMVRDPDERQGLLETNDVAERLSRVTTTAASLSQALAKSRPALN
jgi:Lon protease-like protein